MNNKKEIEKTISSISKEDLVNYVFELKKKADSKKFGLLWEEQPEDIAILMEHNIPYLVFDESRSIINKSINNNLLVEADNYQFLKILKQTHYNSIDVIYIDPPYNRGGDYSYNDKKVNPDDVWKHSKWISFMNKRLKLAKDLLSDEGVMFISIDDVEHAQLRMLCDSIFGPDRVESYIWYLNDKSEGSFEKTPSNTVRVEHEYIIACYKSSPKLGKYSAIRTLTSDCSNPDDDPRGPWFSANISRNGIKSTTGSKYYTIVTPTGKEYTRNWTLSKEEYEEKLKNNEIFFSRNGDGVPRLKNFINEPSMNVQSSVFSDVHTSITGKNQLKETLELTKDDDTFPFPKPTDLIKRLITIACPKSDAIILDFFAGSGTTGQAVMELNKLDNGSRRFLLCTNNEVDEDVEIDYLIKKKILPKMPTSKRSKEYKDFMKQYYEFKDSPEFIKIKEDEEYQELGICRSITHKRLVNFINGYKYSGSKRTELFKTKISPRDVKNNFKNIIEAIDKVIVDNSEKYDEIRKDFRNNDIIVEGISKIEDKSSGVDENLLYYHIGLIEKEDDELDTKDKFMKKINSYIMLHEDVNKIDNYDNYYTISSDDKIIIIYTESVVKKKDTEAIKEIISKAHTYKIYVRAENTNDMNIVDLGISVGAIPDDFMKGIN